MDSETAPNFAQSALVTIDVQRDTLDGQPFEIRGTSAALPHMVTLLQVFRRYRLPIVHVVRIYNRDGSNADRCRRSLIRSGAQLVLRGSPGCLLAAELELDERSRLATDRLLQGGIQEVSSNEYILYKPRWGAFYRTPLQALLRSRGVDTLVFCGCNFPNCPRTSIYEASERDYRIVVARDAISRLNEEGQEELKDIGVIVMTANQIADEVPAAES